MDTVNTAKLSHISLSQYCYCKVSFLTSPLIIMSSCIVITQQNFNVPKSVQNGTQFAKRPVHMAKLQSGQRYVKELAELVTTFKHSDRLRLY